MMTKTLKNASIYLLSIHDVLHSESFVYNVYWTVMLDKKITNLVLHANINLLNNRNFSLTFYLKTLADCLKRV